MILVLGSVLIRYNPFQRTCKQNNMLMVEKGEEEEVDMDVAVEEEGGQDTETVDSRLPNLFVSVFLSPV